jgi:CRP-like cAMP-binding protein
MPLGWNDPHGNDSDDWSGIESAPLLTGVSPDDLKRIATAARLKRLAHGAMLYSEGETVEHVLMLISGSVKITQLGPRGSEVILRLNAPGDVLDAGALCSTGRHSATAQAIRECQALVWDIGVFNNLVGRLPILHQNMTRLICGHLQELEQRFRELATERVAPRVARQLIRLQEQVGSPPKAGVEIGLSGEGLAQMTGTTEYTVSRLLSSWEVHGLVTCRRDSLVISDIKALRKIIEDE